MEKLYQCQTSDHGLRCGLPDGHFGDHRFTEWAAIFEPIHPDRAVLMELLTALEMMENGPGLRGRRWVAFEKEHWERVKLAAAGLAHLRLLLPTMGKDDG